MQCFDNGVFYTVTCTGRDVQNFKDKWPCNGMSNRPVTFQFDKRNGNLVDSNDSVNHPNANGAAIVALCSDAQAYGCKRLKLHNPHAR